MARIKIINEKEAKGRLKEIYIAQKNYGIKMAQIYSVQGLKPNALLNHLEMHAEIMYANSELTRAERELMVIVVSLANGCKYSQHRHADFLNQIWKDESKIASLFIDYHNADLSTRELMLCDFARKLTMMPDDLEDDRYLKELKKIGFSDSGILDCILVVAYANYNNRIALALDLNPDFQINDESLLNLDNLR